MNGCEFTLDKKPNITYDNWAKKWIDIDDKKYVAGQGFQNVIHSVTFPVEDNGKWTTSIDFGSAPIEAFKDLIKTLRGQGIKEVEVHMVARSRPPPSIGRRVVERCQR